MNHAKMLDIFWFCDLSDMISTPVVLIKKKNSRPLKYSLRKYSEMRIYAPLKLLYKLIDMILFSSVFIARYCLFLLIKVSYSFCKILRLPQIKKRKHADFYSLNIL